MQAALEECAIRIGQGDSYMEKLLDAVVDKKINGFDLKFNIDTDLLYDSRSQNANISLNKVI